MHCVKLCTKFSNFFVDKIAELEIAVSSRVTSVACPPDAPHVGSPFESLAAVTPDEVRKILSSLLSHLLSTIFLHL